jgi:hypothetical protein
MTTPDTPLADLLRVLERLGLPVHRRDHEYGADVGLRNAEGSGDPGMRAKFEFDEAGNFLGFGLWGSKTWRERRGIK